ncbi:hypothetical protein Axi01nite_75080 [Actinoplanes xinjiangensis]|nr:hypothetical protein Axi01nite_75080 [Actinoplanes xinjiangensis]
MCFAGNRLVIDGSTYMQVRIVNLSTIAFVSRIRATAAGRSDDHLHHVAGDDVLDGHGHRGLRRAGTRPTDGTVSHRPTINFGRSGRAPVGYGCFPGREAAITHRRTIEWLAAGTSPWAVEGRGTVREGSGRAGRVDSGDAGTTERGTGWPLESAISPLPGS